MASSVRTHPALNFELDRSSGRPLHRQLLEHYRELIERGELPAGSRLPTEMELSERYRISRGTVRQALRALSEAGLVHRKTRNGTVVRTLTQARGVQAGRIIGVIFPEARDAFCLDIMKGVQAACRGRGYHAAFGYSHHSSALERAEVTRMRAAGFGGVLVLPHADPTLFNELLTDAYPFVVIDQFFADLPGDFVGVDNVRASFGATEHLIRLGHRRVAFVHQNPDLTRAPSTVRDRHQGYREALAAFNLTFRSPWLSAAQTDADYARFLTLAERPSAVVAANDDTALKLMGVAAKVAVRVPEELAVVGFDNTPPAVGGSLTTVVQPSMEMGARAAQLLIDRIEGDRSLPRRVILPTRLVVRESCGTHLR